MAASVLRLNGLNHVTLSVANLDMSENFYVRVLGGQRYLRWASGAYIGIGDLWLCLSLGTPQPANDYSHIALTMQATDRIDWQARLEANGVAIWQPNRSEGDSIYCQDPDGHKLELHAGTLTTRLISVARHPYRACEFTVTLQAFPRIDSNRPLRVAALCGSVRQGSVNAGFLRALARYAPDTMNITPYFRMAELPVFNPDIDPDTIGNDALDVLIDLVRTADVMITACPEYAGGLPGAFKNALDHLAGTDVLVAKPFIQYNLEPSAFTAQMHLQSILETISCLPLEPGPVAVDRRLANAMPELLHRLELALRATVSDKP